MSKISKKRPIIESDSDGSDASDLDQELLSLASAAKRQKTSPAPPAPQPPLLAGSTAAAAAVAGPSSGSGSSSENDSDGEWNPESKSKKAAALKAKKPQGRVPMKGVPHKRMGGGKRVVARHSSTDSSDEEDDDGEAQGLPGTTQPSSTSGAASTSSDSESSSDDMMAKFDDGLDESLVGDEEDRRILDLMKEADREQEMYNRYEKRQALKARFEIEQKLRRERKSKRSRQKDREERQKRLLREKRGKQTDKSRSRAIDELKAKRTADKQRKAEVEKQQQQQQQQRKVEPLKAQDVYSSESEEESTSSSSSGSGMESDDDIGDGTMSALRKESKFISKLEELSKVRLSRFRMEKWVHMPFFSETLIGCFARVGIGAHDGRMVYRVCEIIGVQEMPKVYTLGSTKTNKGLRMRHGLQERLFRMEYVSNSGFSESEFSKWIKEMERHGLPLPTLSAISKKIRQLEEAKNFALNDDDIERMIQEKQKFRKNPRNYAMTMSRLLRDKELAELEGDVDKASNLNQKIEELKERAEELDKQRTKGLSVISYINERNRQRNVTRAEQALKEEMAEEKTEDPFTRRKCQPTLVTLTREAAIPGTSELLQHLAEAQTAEEKEAIQASLKDTVSELVSPTASNGQTSKLPHLQSDTTSNQLTPALPPIEQNPEVEDLFSAHDFDIQIDLPSAPKDHSTVKNVPKAIPTQKMEGPKRSLNLADYKKRKGLI